MVVVTYNMAGHKLLHLSSGAQQVEEGRAGKIVFLGGPLPPGLLPGWAGAALGTL